MKDAMLIAHFLGLAMGLGTSIGFMILGIASSKLEKAAALDFTLKTFALSKMGHIGITLLILSGGYMMTDLWSNLANMPMLIAKLVLVVILVLFIILISINARKAKQSDDPMPYLQKIRGLGPPSLLVGLAILVLAVLQFH